MLVGWAPAVAGPRPEDDPAEDAAAAGTSKDDCPIEPGALREAFLASLRRRRVMLGDPVGGARLEELWEALGGEQERVAAQGGPAAVPDTFDDGDLQAGVSALSTDGLSLANFNTIREEMQLAEAGISTLALSLSRMASHRDSMASSCRVSHRASRAASFCGSQRASRCASRAESRMSCSRSPAPGDSPGGSGSAAASPRKLSMHCAGPGAEASNRNSSARDSRVGSRVGTRRNSLALPGMADLAGAPLQDAGSGARRRVVRTSTSPAVVVAHFDERTPATAAEGGDKPEGAVGSAASPPGAASAASSGQPVAKARLLPLPLTPLVESSRPSIEDPGSERPSQPASPSSSERAGAGGERGGSDADSAGGRSSADSNVPCSPSEVAKLRAALADTPSDARLKDLLDRDGGIGEFGLGSLLRAAKEMTRRQDLASVSEEDQEEGGSEEAESEVDGSSARESQGEADVVGGLLSGSVLEGVHLDPGMVNEVLKMLVMLNKGMQTRHCNCRPGEPHTCMSPVASILASQIQSLQQSLAHSVSQSLAHTRVQSRRVSGDRRARRSQGALAVPPDVPQPFHLQQITIDADHFGRATLQEGSEWKEPPQPSEPGAAAAAHTADGDRGRGGCAASVGGAPRSPGGKDAPSSRAGPPESSASAPPAPPVPMSVPMLSADAGAGPAAAALSP